MSDKGKDKIKKQYASSGVSTKHLEQFTAQSLIAYAYENDVITVNEFRHFLRLPALEQGRIVKRFYDNARLMSDKAHEKSDKMTDKADGDVLSSELAEAVARKRDEDTLVLPPRVSAKSVS
jgi:hypothetical protein